jgi:hypothetical protein
MHLFMAGLASGRSVLVNELHEACTRGQLLTKHGRR